MPSELERRGKRGGYAEGTNVNLSLDSSGKFWNINRIKDPEPLFKGKKDVSDKQILTQGNISDVDNRRTAKSKVLNANRRELINEIILKEALRQGYAEDGKPIPNETEGQFARRQKKQEIEATNRVDAKIGKYSGTKKQKDFGFSEAGKAKLEDAKRIYAERIPFDAQSEKLREGEDKSAGKLYDSLRSLKKSHSTAIAINKEFIDLDKIDQVTSTGRRIPASSNIITEKEAKKDKDGKVKLGKDEVILAKGESITSYRISTETIKPGIISAVTGKMSVSVSTEIRKSETIRTARTIGAPPSEGKLGYDQEIAVQESYAKREAGKGFIYRQSNRLYFYREGNELVVGLKDKDGNILYNTNIGIILANALKKQGTGTGTIYINNIPFTDSDFIQGADGRWRLQPIAETELNAPEIDGRISARLSDKYQPQFKILSETTKALRPEKAPQKLYGQFESFATIIGSQDGKTIINEYSIDARVAIKYLKLVTKEKGAGYSVIATDFTVAKQGQMTFVGLDKIAKMKDTSKSNYYGFVFPNTGGDENAAQFQSYEKFIQIAIVGDKLMVTIKSPDIDWAGLMPIPGSPP